MVVVTPTERPKSVSNRCVIEGFGGVFVLSRYFVLFFCGCRGLCHRAESDFFFFSLHSLFRYIPGITIVWSFRETGSLCHTVRFKPTTLRWLICPGTTVITIRHTRLSFCANEEYEALHYSSTCTLTSCSSVMKYCKRWFYNTQWNIHWSRDKWSSVESAGWMR